MGRNEGSQRGKRRLTDDYGEEGMKKGGKKRYNKGMRRRRKEGMFREGMKEGGT